MHSYDHLSAALPDDVVDVWPHCRLCRPRVQKRQWLLARLCDSVHLPVEQAAAAVEAWARYQSDPGVRPFSWAETLPLDASIGRYASEHLDKRPDVVKAMILRIDALPPSDRVVADVMTAMLFESAVAEAMDFIVRRIGRGEADAALIAAALRRREVFCRSASSAVEQLSRGSGQNRAVAATMQRDSAAAAKVLQTGDGDSTALLLATAKLSRWQLPLQTLTARAASDASVDKLTDIYLATVDTAETRALYYSRDRSTIPISGEQFPWPDPSTTCGMEGGATAGLRFAGEEAALRDELRAGKMREVRAFFVVDHCRFPKSSVVIRVKNDGSGTVSLLAGTAPSAGKERVLGEEEVRVLLARLDSFGLEALPALSLGTRERGVFGASRCEYFRANRKNGRRLIFLSEDAVDDFGYGKARRLFKALADGMGGATASIP